MSKEKKESYYFSHDCGACRDVKIMKLRQEYEWEGYGVFWAIIEALRETSNHEIPLDMVDAMLYDLRIKKEIFDYLFECKLLEKNDTVFYSNSLIKRMEMKKDISRARSESGRKGGKVSKKRHRHDDNKVENKESLPEVEPPKIKPTDGNITGLKNIPDWSDAIGVLSPSQVELAIIKKLSDVNCIPEDAKKARLANMKYFGKITGDNAQRLVINQRDMRINGIEPQREKTDEEIWGENLRKDLEPYIGKILPCKK
jgi:hypothetical protein